MDSEISGMTWHTSQRTSLLKKKNDANCAMQVIENFEAALHKMKCLLISLDTKENENHDLHITSISKNFHAEAQAF